MAGFHLVISFALIVILSFCEGQIQSPSNGSKLIFLPQTTVKIDWSYIGDITKVDLRSWFFNSSDGSRTGRLARIVDDGDPGKKNVNLIPRYEIDKPAALILKNVDQNYNGMYIFTLQNRQAAQPESSSVVVFIAKKPTVTLNCSSSILDIGDDFICECKGLNGNPPAKVTWYKDGNQMQGKTGTEEQLLTLIKVDETDSGTYKCVAESYFDPLYRDEKSIRLYVRFGPKNTSIQLNPNPATLGQSLTITCSSRGFPEPTYKIFFNGDQLIDGKMHTNTNVQKSHAGVYECSAENGVGPTDKASESLKVTERSLTTQKPPIPTTNEKYTSNRSGNKEEVVAWRIVVSLLSGIIIGILSSYIFLCFRRRWCRNRKPERNSERQTDGVDTNYQELDLTKMNTENNYQSLRGNVAVSASNDAANDDESTYTQLSKTRDVEDNYQSLT